MQGRRDSVTVFFVTSLIALGADLASKSAVFSWVESRGGEVVLVPGWLSFVSRLNQRALFSLGPENGGFANIALAIISSLAVIAIPLWAWFTLKRGQRLLGFVLGCILGGAAGNLHDRLMFGGVRDFIDAHYHEIYHWPTFNLADSFLVCGAIFLVLASFFSPPADDDAEPTPPSLST